MDSSKKVRILMATHNITATELAKRTKISQSNLSKKLKNNSFSIDDLEKIAEAVDAEYEGFFTLKNGDKI